MYRSFAQAIQSWIDSAPSACSGLLLCGRTVMRRGLSVLRRCGPGQLGGPPHAPRGWAPRSRSAAGPPDSLGPCRPPRCCAASGGRCGPLRLPGGGAARRPLLRVPPPDSLRSRLRLATVARGRRGRAPLRGASRVSPGGAASRWRGYARVRALCGAGPLRWALVPPLRYAALWRLRPAGLDLGRPRLRPRSGHCIVRRARC